MAQIRWSAQARRDLSNIAEFISKDSPKYALITLKKVISQTDVLNKEPRIGRVVPELGVDSIRELIYANYRIVYQVGNEEIVILTVHHSAMLFDTSKFA